METEAEKRVNMSVIEEDESNSKVSRIAQCGEGEQLEDGLLGKVLARNPEELSPSGSKSSERRERKTFKSLI